MRKYAFIKEDIVVKIDYLSDEKYQEEIKNYQNIIDINDMLVQPLVGYGFNGIGFSAPQGESDLMKKILKEKITYYQKIATELLTELYVENTMAGLTISQSDSLFEQYSDVILRLKEGAFPTALYRLSQKAPSGFVTQELLDSWKNRILEKMI